VAFSLIENEKCAVVDDCLVIADLHIGYETDLKKRGYDVHKLITQFLKEISNLKIKTGASKLIILGDVKHKIPRMTVEEKYDIPFFFRKLSDIFDEIILIKGNHDGYIERIIREPKVKIVKEYIYKEYGFIHGHSYPSEELMQSRIVFMAHTHPSFKVIDQLGIKHVYPSWVLGKLNPKKLERYKEIKVERIIIVPAFNPFFSGYGKIAGPLAKAIKNKEIFLLDLTKVA